ncbi:gp08 [Alphaproteobacteria phage PhiJL001]|uniref:Gp08 n=1 Tax=Alphaproteobacteria phage PhiJL001 TaxID=2681607 RepID=Q5DN97_9CAUD|nr:gp08 [Alphaproteobacteria phage PhiJL001]AAT69462.1 gp08 [Alphaproteobacteria phage PhiJL001]
MTVYAVQSPRHRQHGQMVPKYDLAPAEEFGEVVELLSPTAKPFNPKPLIDELYVKLEKFSDDDHIICIGNPILLSMAVTIASDVNNGRVKLLQWHGHQGKYISVQVDMGFTSASDEAM